MSQRWIAFRDGSASTSGSLPIGLGWRGASLRAVETPEEVDRRVTTATAGNSAFAVWSLGELLYGVAVHEDATIRFALNVDERSEDWPALRDRCGVGASVAGWRQRTALALADWSAHTPRTSDPLELDAILQSRGEPAAIVASWFELLGLAVPVERDDQLDAAAQARMALAARAELKRQRRMTPTPTW